MDKDSKKIAYIIPGPRDYLTLEVRASANAWWMDAPKLYKLVTLLDQGTSLKTACEITGITMRQYAYFAELHPLIEERRQMPYTELSLRAKISLARAIEAGDSKASLAYLKMKEPESYDLRYKGPEDPKPGRGRRKKGDKTFWGWGY